MTGLFVLSALVPADMVTKRTVTYTVNAGTPVVLDMTNPATTFPVNAGDAISATAVDTNVVGDSPASAPFTATAPSGPPTAVPTTPTITGITFTP